MGQGMASYSVVFSDHVEAAMARNTYALEQDPIIPQLSLPFRRTAVLLVLEREKYARTLGKYLGVEEGTSVDALESVAVLEQDTPVVMVAGKLTVAVDIPVGVGDKRIAEADTSGESTVAGGRSEDSTVVG